MKFSYPYVYLYTTVGCSGDSYSTMNLGSCYAGMKLVKGSAVSGGGSGGGGGGKGSSRSPTYSPTLGPMSLSGNIILSNVDFHDIASGDEYAVNTVIRNSISSTLSLSTSYIDDIQITQNVYGVSINAYFTISASGQYLISLFGGTTASTVANNIEEYIDNRKSTLMNYIDYYASRGSMSYSTRQALTYSTYESVAVRAPSSSSNSNDDITASSSIWQTVSSVFLAISVIWFVEICVAAILTTALGRSHREWFNQKAALWIKIIITPWIWLCGILCTVSLLLIFLISFSRVSGLPERRTFINAFILFAIGFFLNNQYLWNILRQYIGQTTTTAKVNVDNVVVQDIELQPKPDNKYIPVQPSEITEVEKPEIAL